MDSDVAFTYTRKQALENGVLIDITDIAKEIGFISCVAVTSTVWHGYIVSAKEIEYFGQSVKGRVWDVISRLYFQILCSEPTDVVHFQTVFMMPDERHIFKCETVGLKAVVRAGDNVEPVLTIMLPEDDGIRIRI